VGSGMVVMYASISIPVNVMQAPHQVYETVSIAVPLPADQT
jgi:hypothetical protein